MKYPMTNEERNLFQCSDFVIRISFVIGYFIIRH